MNVLYVFADSENELNCSKHNCWFPAEAVNKIEGNQGICIHVDKFTSNTVEVQEVVTKADIIIVERNLFGDTLSVMQYWKGRGKTILTIFDDAYDLIHELNPAYPFWIKSEVTVTDKETGKEYTLNAFPKPLDMLVWGIQISKGLQVPSLALASDWRKYNNTYYVPNYIRIDKYLNVEPLFPHDDIIIGWGGSLSHLSSFNESGVLPALKEIVKRYKNVRVMITGDKKVFDAVDIPENKKVFSGFVKEEDFPRLLKTFDIAIAPLSGEFDKRRSRIKVLEYMALQIPWIASDYPPYHEFREFGMMTKNTPLDWETKLRLAVKHNVKLKDKAKGPAFEYAKGQSYDANIQNTLGLYMSLLTTPYSGHLLPPTTT